MEVDAIVAEEGQAIEHGYRFAVAKGQIAQVSGLEVVSCEHEGDSTFVRVRVPATKAVRRTFEVIVANEEEAVHVTGQLTVKGREVTLDSTVTEVGADERRTYDLPLPNARVSVIGAASLLGECQHVDGATVATLEVDTRAFTRGRIELQADNDEQWMVFAIPLLVRTLTTLKVAPLETDEGVPATKTYDCQLSGAKAKLQRTPGLTLVGKPKHLPGVTRVSVQADARMRGEWLFVLRVVGEDEVVVCESNACVSGFCEHALEPFVMFAGQDRVKDYSLDAAGEPRVVDGPVTIVVSHRPMTTAFRAAPKTVGEWAIRIEVRVPRLLHVFRQRSRRLRSAAQLSSNRAPGQLGRAVLPWWTGE
jgi:hypothetical protein